jgi:hypothetical protein
VCGEGVRQNGGRGAQQGEELGHENSVSRMIVGKDEGMGEGRGGVRMGKEGGVRQKVKAWLLKSMVQSE